MEVEYELTPEDLLAFQRYHRRNPPHPQQRGSPAAALTGIFIFLALVAAVLFFDFSDNPTAAWYLMAVPFVVLGAALAVFGLLVYARLTASRQMLRLIGQGRNAEKMLGWRRLFVDAEAVRSTAELSAGTYLWAGIDRVGSTADHAFFYVNTYTAVIVPRRAFRDDRAFEDFLEEARHYHRMSGDVRRGAWDHRPTAMPPPGPRGGASDDRITRGDSGRP